MKLKTKTIEQEEHTLIQTEAEFAFWVSEMGWESVEEFVEETGVTFDDCKGSWCYLCDNRVYTVPA